MRICLLAALAVIVSAAGCTTLKPSHREYKKASRAEAAMEGQAAGQVQQVQYTAPAGVPAGPPAGVQQAGHHHLQSATGPYGYAGYGYGSAPYGGGAPYVHGGGPPDRGHPGRPFDGGRYGFFGGAHRTPGYPHHHFAREYVGPQGPPSAQTAYPYYTIRGPRDFLLDNPPSIGR